MKQVRQTRWVLYRGRVQSKVYEIELCEMGDARYVVNYRYGRVGELLKEGTKTVDPVSLPKAEKLFAELEAARLKQGYVPEGVDPAEMEVPEVPEVETPSVTGAPAGSRLEVRPDDARAAAVLHKLNHPTQGRRWPLPRVIWRAGELRLREASPRLLEMLGNGRGLRDYCIVWALGRCGDASALGRLGSLMGSASTDDAVRRIAAEAMLALYDASGRASLRRSLVDTLPDAIREAARTGPATRFTDALQSYLDPTRYETFSVLHTLYLIDSEQVRPGVMEALRKSPMGPGSFKAFRHVYKAAEYRQDAEVFGLLAYRFEKTPAFFHRPRWGAYRQIRGRFQWLNADRIAQELRSDDAALAYSHKTRNYFRRRVWTTLRRLAELGEAEAYVKLAVGVLLEFSDGDQVRVRRQQYWYPRRTLVWDVYAPYIGLGHLLYENSPRYRLPTATHAWRCRDGYEPGQPPPSTREEAFPEMWDAVPAALLHLLDESACEEVHHFAVKALEANDAFCAKLGAEAITMLLGAPYAVTARLGLRLAQRLYDPANPDIGLVRALLNAVDSQARKQAFDWIEAQPALFVTRERLVLEMLTSTFSDVASFVTTLLSMHVPETEMQLAWVRQLTDFLKALGSEHEQLAQRIVESIRDSLSAALSRMNVDDILALLEVESMAAHELAGEIAVAQDSLGSSVHDVLIERLVGSPYEAVQAIGVRLFGKLPDAMLLDREQLIVAFCVHERASLREAIRETVQRLTQSFPSFGGRLLDALVTALMRPQLPQGAATHLVQLITVDLESALATLSAERVWALIQAESSAARELGGLLLPTHLRADALSVRQLAELTHNEIISIREAGYAMLRDQLTRVKRELEDALRVLTSPWADARLFGFGFFGGDDFDAEDYTPELLISICDSVLDDVQQFGRRLITRFFEERDGATYLMRLSEHPTTAMQTFASAYLERYASGRPERIESMGFYFSSVLLRINQGRVARQRALAFLKTEATRSRDAAQVIARLLGPISAICTIGARAEIIETLVHIATEHPDIETPLTLSPVELRGEA